MESLYVLKMKMITDRLTNQSGKVTKKEGKMENPIERSNCAENIWTDKEKNERMPRKEAK